MRGTLTFKDKSYRTVHLSTGEDSPHVSFSLYNFESDEFKPVLTLLDYRLFVPGNGGLHFSGYRIPENFDGLEDRPEVGVFFEFVEADFFPCRRSVDDLWARKCAGQSGKTDTYIKE